MSTVVLNGVPVDFPFEPYALQKTYMEKVIECLQNETNGVLESPTGTGKTLSLLCSSLAWLQLKKAQVQAQTKANIMNDDGNEFLNQLRSELSKVTGGANKQNGRAFIGLPSIIYASRTHSQLSQAMQELKRTSYSHMKACVLGSRVQMCINPEIQQQQDSSMKIHMCQIKVKTRSCHFYNRVEKKKEDPAVNGLSIIDIEDIVKLGETHKFCPYFMSKELQQQADIIFMPYNYLLDPRARKALGVKLENNVIILDEAHNVDRICEDSASLDIKSSDIAMAMEEVTAVMKSMTDEISFSNTPKDFDHEELAALKEMLLKFEAAVDEVEIKSNNSEPTVFEGSYMFELFNKAGINDGNHNIVISIIDKIIQFLATVNEGPFQRRGAGLQIFQDLLLIGFASISSTFKEKLNKCYKVHLIEEQPKKKTGDNWLSKATAKSGGRILSFWCLSPGFGMNTLMEQNVRCVILTSGTLAPLRPLISELELNVSVRLENPHIVKGDQICVKIIGKGPDNEILNSNYQNRDNPNYINSLGRTILNLTRIIPNGLLIFFPSYPIMQNCKQHWQENGIWSNIYEQKPIYVEPKDKASFTSAMTDYYAKITDPTCKGAIFMGVCRGKVSEGLDFADANGRAVIVTGLPYPPLKDPRIILKKRYLDACNMKDKEYLNGNDWYSLEATRAINQAIGRVIRHKNDYGAILLLDARFDNYRIKNQLSLWLRDHLRVVNNFGEIIRDLRGFFRNAETKFPVSLNKKPQKVPINSEPAPEDTYTKNNFDFSTSTLFPSTSQSRNPNGEVTIHKRSINDALMGVQKKRKKITLVSNSSGNPDAVKNSHTEYIAMVKKALDGESFQKFIKALTCYRNNDSIEELFSLLDDIFLTKYSLRYLILGLQVYIKDRHKDAFNTYWENMRL